MMSHSMLPYIQNEIATYNAVDNASYLASRHFFIHGSSCMATGNRALGILNIGTGLSLRAISNSYLTGTFFPDNTDTVSAIAAGLIGHAYLPTSQQVPRGLFEQMGLKIYPINFPNRERAFIDGTTSIIVIDGVSALLNTISGLVPFLALYLLCGIFWGAGNLLKMIHGILKLYYHNPLLVICS